MHKTPRPLIKGRLTMWQRDVDTGSIGGTRYAENSVLRGGAELLAALFDGSMTTPINAMSVGLNPDPPEPPYETTALTTTDGGGTTLLDLPAAPLGSDAITSRVDTETFRVILTIHGVIPADRAVSPDPGVESVEVSEAALGVLSVDGTTLDHMYNRVVFEPLPKRRNHELAFYWEVDFPYGT